MNSETGFEFLGEGASESAASPLAMGYFRATRTATYGFVLAVPLIILYEVLIRWANRGFENGGGVRISSEVWLRMPMDTAVGQWLQGELLSWGITAEIGMFIVIVLVGLGIFLWDRKRKVPLKVRYGAGILAESAVYAVMVAFLASILTHSVVRPELIIQATQELSLFHELVLSLGAGIYEELLFRVLLVGGLFLVLKRLAPRWLAYLLAAVVGALLFSWIHYIGSFGDEFTMVSFTYRAFGGLVLNALYLVRGFGVTAWTHALYDVYVVTGVFDFLGG